MVGTEVVVVGDVVVVVPAVVLVVAGRPAVLPSDKAGGFVVAVRPP